MTRHIRTIEDGFEYRVKAILKGLSEGFVEDGYACTFEEWLRMNTKTVANAFLDDIDSYMGLSECINELNK